MYVCRYVFMDVYIRVCILLQLFDVCYCEQTENMKTSACTCVLCAHSMYVWRLVCACLYMHVCEHGCIDGWTDGMDNLPMCIYVRLCVAAYVCTSHVTYA